MLQSHARKKMKAQAIWQYPNSFPQYFVLPQGKSNIYAWQSSNFEWRCLKPKVSIKALTEKAKCQPTTFLRNTPVRCLTSPVKQQKAGEHLVLFIPNEITVSKLPQINCIVID